MRVDDSGNTTGAVSMALLGVVTTNRPPVSEATVRIANSGDVTVRPRLSAVDDWSPAGSVPVEPSELELRQGRHSDVRVRTRRPLVRPVSRQRRGVVTVFADVDGRLVPGIEYAVPPMVGWRAVAVFAAVLVVGIGAFVLRAAGPADRGAPDAATAPVERSSATPVEPAPPADEGALPADVVLDAPAAADAGTHSPVLVGRDRSRVFLPPGGPVTHAVKVPSGWVVKRQVGGARFQVLYLRGAEVLDLAPGVPDPSFRVDETGTRVALDGRDGAAGAVTMVSLPGGDAETTAVLPAHVRVIAWLGRELLVGVRDTVGAWHYGRWSTAAAYEDMPSPFAGSFLGAWGGGAVAIHQREGALDCIVQVTDLELPAKHSLRCGFGVPVDRDVLDDRWSAVSPGGRFVAVPGPNRSAYFAPMPAMLKGLVGFEPAAGLPGPVLDVAWRDGATAALLVGGDDTQLWACAAEQVACRATPVDGPAGLSPVLLAARVPAGR